MSKSGRSKIKSNKKLHLKSNDNNEISYVSDEEEKSTSSNGSKAQQQTDSSSNKLTYYYYHKILSSNQYSLGKKVEEFLIRFEEVNKSVEDGAKTLPKPLHHTVKIINELVSDLYSNYNISGNNKNLMQFCRASVEKYIFGKVYSKIFSMYLIKYKEANEKFAKRSAVIKATDPIKMLEHLGVNKKYIICDNFQFSNSNQTYEFMARQEAIQKMNEHSETESERSEGSTAEGQRLLPYYEAIKSLERISNFTSPREKID